MSLKNVMQNIFSIKNENEHKVFVFLGVKFRTKNKFVKLQNFILELFNQNNNTNRLLLQKYDSFFSSLDYITNILNCVNKPFLYDKTQWEMSYLKKFYEEIKQIDYKSAYQELIKNLDDLSIETTNKILARTQSACSTNDSAVDIFDKTEMCFIEERKKSFWNKIFELNENCWAYKKYFLPVNHFEICVFEDKHFIDSLNIDYFKNKHIIDAGAFIGDSAIIFSDYTSKKVHSFEPTVENFENLQKTITLNNKDNIVPVKKALGDTNGYIELFKNGSASGILDVKDTKSKETCELMTLDEYVRINHLEIGLIKTDLEGAEQIFLKGAENTIKSQKPSLLISIYHSADDFFKIKPIIESWDLGYKFRIVKPTDGQILLETMLIAEVEPRIKK